METTIFINGIRVISLGDYVPNKDGVIVRRVNSAEDDISVQDVLRSMELSFCILSKEAFENMPQSGEGETDVFLFNVGRRITNNEREKEYASRGLKPVNPRSLALANKNDPELCNLCPNCTFWEKEGNEFYIAFSHSFGKKDVFIDEDDDAGCSGETWFAGVKKGESESA